MRLSTIVQGDFQCIVAAIEAPTIVQRHAGFPRAAFLRSLDVLLRSGEIAGQQVAVVHDDIGLEREDHLVHALGFPLFGVQRPGHVVPEDVDLAVVGHQLADEAVGVVDEAAARGLVGLADGAVGVVPVHERVVEADAQAFGAGGLNDIRGRDRGRGPASRRCSR